MSDADLVKELRSRQTIYCCIQRTHLHAADYHEGRNVIETAADRIEALASEVERLAELLAAVRDDAMRADHLLCSAEAREMGAARALAEAVEIMRPFASRDMSAINDCVDNHGMRYQSQWFANATAAASDFITAQEKEK